ncbi:MAG: ABC transporter ATP-binding protein [Firmicutes bacterium]|nr:ABC transporter ATP-binding protein [Bacillota bacterium]
MIELSNVSKEYIVGGSQLSVLQKLSLNVAPAEFVSIIGQSGCGKTTLLHMIAGLNQPTEGQIRIRGKLVKGPGRDRGLVFQEPRLFPWATVAHNIRLGLPDRGRDEGRLWELLRLVGLQDFAQAYPRELSGGMAQRAALARALAGSPEILLLDEPLGALDAVTRLKMQDQLMKIWQEGSLTVVAVTHDIDEAIVLSTRIVVLSPRPGRIKGIIPVDLPYPRDRTALDFNVYRQELLAVLE